MTPEQLGSEIFRAGMLVEGVKRHEEMGRVAMEYVVQKTASLEAENVRLRGALAKIADMPTGGVYVEIARAALNGGNA